MEDVGRCSRRETVYAWQSSAKCPNECSACHSSLLKRVMHIKFYLKVLPFIVTGFMACSGRDVFQIGDLGLKCRHSGAFWRAEELRCSCVDVNCIKWIACVDDISNRLWLK